MYWNQVACDRSALATDMYKWESQPLSNDECLSHADANGDGKVDIADILVIMVNWDKETSGGVVDENCIPNVEELSRYYSNFNQIYSTLTGESDEVVQMRNKLEALFGFSPTPTEYKIKQNYPNPFNPSTTIPYYLPRDSRVKLVVFDVMGRKVIEKGEYFREQGSHTIIINGKNLSSGVYTYQFIIDGNKTITTKMVLLR